MTLKELKEAVWKLGAKPSDLFEVDLLEDDPAVATLVRAAKQTEYEHAKRVERKLGEERDAWAKERVALERAVAEKSAHALLLDRMEARGLSAAANVFLRRHLREFTTTATDDAALLADVERFLDGQVTEWREVEKILRAPGTPATEPEPEGPIMGPPPPPTDPANNKMIPQGEAPPWDPDDPTDKRNPANNRLIPDPSRREERPNNPMIPE